MVLPFLPSLKKIKFNVDCDMDSTLDLSAQCVCQAMDQYSRLLSNVSRFSSLRTVVVELDHASKAPMVFIHAAASKFGSAWCGFSHMLYELSVASEILFVLRGGTDDSQTPPVTQRDKDDLELFFKHNSGPLWGSQGPRYKLLMEAECTSE